MIPDYLAALRQTKRTSAKNTGGKTLNALDALNARSNTHKQAAPTEIDTADKSDSIDGSVSVLQTTTCAKGAISAISASRYQNAYDALEHRCPDFVETERTSKTCSSLACRWRR